MTRFLAVLVCLPLFGCNPLDGVLGVGPAGEQGPEGPRGHAGPIGPQGEPGSDSKAGTRLKRQYRISEDGGRAFDSWYDTHLGMPCAWRPAIDGSERCMPADARAAQPGLWYRDNLCEEAVAVINENDCGTLPPAMTYKLPGECVYRVRRISTQVDDVDNVFAIAGGNCIPVSVGENSLVYNVDEELDATAMVASAVKIE